MKKILFLIFIFMSTSCTVSMTIVYAPKDQFINGNNNTPQISGSDLKGNSASQETKSAFDIILESMFN